MLLGKEVFKRRMPKCLQMLYFVVFGHQDPFDMIQVKSRPTSRFGSKKGPFPG